MYALKYPDVREDNIVDMCHGTPIPDPYRWLEDLGSNEVKRFIKDQNQLTDSYLSEGEIRLNIKERVSDVCSIDEYECPFRRGDRYFHFKNNILYMLTSLDEDGDGQIVFDPSWEIFDINVSFSTSIFDKSGESFGDRLYSISPNGEVFAYGLSKSGSDWCTIHFKNVIKADFYPDKLKKVKDSCLSWTHDSQGLIYERYPDIQTYHDIKVYYHLLGTMQSEDQIIVEFEDNPTWELKAKVSECGHYLIVFTAQDCGGKSRVFYTKLLDSYESKPVLLPIVKDFEADYNYITNTGSLFYFLTNEGAPNSRILSVITFPDEDRDPQWNCIVEEHPKNVLDWASCVNQDYLVTCYLQNVTNTLQLRKLEDGSLIKQFPLGLGTITGFSGRAQDTEMFFVLSTFLTPGTIYHVNLKDSGHSRICSCLCPAGSSKMKCRVFKECSPEGFDPTNYTTSHVFYSSKDRTPVSLFIVHKKNLVRNGKSPCLLYGYGGFNETVKPKFDAINIAFIQSFDGIYAQANIRGGGYVSSGKVMLYSYREYGRKWYEAGIRLNKQNCFDDFQAAAEYLIKNKYTCSEKLAIRGNSNGGLLVGACINQRPDLFGAAVAGFGVMDLLRFHKFTTGPCWISDYGCSDDKVDFENLLKISPLHNVKAPEDQKTQYPAVLLITGDHDDRVVPLHSFKMIAKLQKEIGHLSWQRNPLLIRIESDVGHGDTLNFDSSISTVTDLMMFLMIALDLSFK